jgi:hypothetical protein
MEITDDVEADWLAAYEKGWGVPTGDEAGDVHVDGGVGDASMSDYETSEDANGEVGNDGETSGDSDNSEEDSDWDTNTTNNNKKKKTTKKKRERTESEVDEDAEGGEEDADTKVLPNANDAQMASRRFEEEDVDMVEGFLIVASTRPDPRDRFPPFVAYQGRKIFLDTAMLGGRPKSLASARPSVKRTQSNTTSSDAAPKSPKSKAPKVKLEATPLATFISRSKLTQSQRRMLQPKTRPKAATPIPKPEKAASSPPSPTASPLSEPSEPPVLPERSHSQPPLEPPATAEPPSSSSSSSSELSVPSTSASAASNLAASSSSEAKAATPAAKQDVDDVVTTVR